MAGNLVTRVEKLEEKADIDHNQRFRMVRICTSDQDIAAVHEEARCRGIPSAGGANYPACSATPP